MKPIRLFLLAYIVFILSLQAATVSAVDLVIAPQTLNGPSPIIYDSIEGIVLDAVVINSGANVTADAAYEVTLKPGTKIKSGARFVVRMKDKDGMSNRCEMTYFGNLDQNPDDDFDGDQLTNNQECQLNIDPTVNNPDNDGDGMADWWEVLHFGLDLSQDRNDDFDSDGISNWIEYRLGTDPAVANAKGPGIYYQYDQLGRMRKIERIPGR